MLKLCYTTTMKKRIITVLIISILILSLPIEIGAKTLKGEVKYTVKQAREEAFSNVEYTLPQSIIKANLTDPNYKENKKAIKLGATELKDRYITYAADGSYGIIYKNNLYYEYDYFPNGKLEGIGKRNGLTYPVVSYFYNTQNELTELMLYVNEYQAFQFKANGQLLYHWINNKCYDENGKIINEVYQ